MVDEFTIMATYCYLKNLKDGQSEGLAQGNAVWLASVVGSKKAGGWSGQKRTQRSTPQVIASQITVRRGKVTETRRFGGRVMNARAFGKLVVEKTWPHFSELLQAVKKAIDADQEYPDLVLQLKARFRES